MRLRRLSDGGSSGLTWSSVPALPNSVGSAGDIAYDGSYLYLATGANAWRRVSLPAWDVPTAIPGLQLWLDASYAASLYDATSGGSVVAADGAVARWEDRSGNGRHATQSTSENRPLRKTSIQNGRDVIRFDGSSDSLTIGSSATTLKFLHSAQSTVFLVMKPSFASDYGAFGAVMCTGLTTGFADAGYNIVFNDNSPNTDMLDVIVGRNGDPAYCARDRIDNAMPSGSFALFSIVGDMTNSTQASRVKIRKNGGSESSVALDTSYGAANTSDSSGSLTIGAATGASIGTLNGDVAELIIYDSAISDASRAAVEGYLMTKWGIS